MSSFPGASLPSLIAQRTHALNQIGLASSLTKLSTGLKINRGADNPAGLIASENLKSALAALEAESRTLERVNSVSTVADGALTEVSNLLIEAKGLAVANASSTGVSDAERQANQMQIDSILTSVDRISNTTTFNGDRLLDGSASLTTSDATLDIDSVAVNDLGSSVISGQSLDLSDVASAGSLNTATGDVSKALQVIDAAISDVATQRGKIGSFQKDTISTSLNSINVAIENISAANSSIRDTDFAAETTNLIRSQLLTKSSLLTLDLTNRMSEGVLSLIS